MRSLKSFFHAFPALSRALAIALGSSLALLIGLRIWLDDARPKVWLLGDSCIGNYRPRPGERLEDALGSRLPDTKVRSWAEPGARPYDLWLQDRKGRLLAGKPSAIVVAFSPDKFYGDSLDRFDEGGANLRWLPWDRDGLRLLERLDASEFDAAVAEQFDVLGFAVADAARALWLRHVQWPWERRRMLEASPDRARRIEEKTRQLGKGVEAMEPGDDASFASMPRTRDMEQVLGFWKAEAIPVLVILHPYANPQLLARTWSTKALDRRDCVNALMHRWLERQPIKVIDLNEPERLASFPDSTWDDHSHLKAPSSFRHLAELIAARLELPKDQGKPWRP